ncbi:hypothetical protein Tco_1500947 [Tanacetum coccineum]
MAGLDFCSKHNMVAYLEKNDGNTEFHQIIDFLTHSSIYYALTVSPIVLTSFVEQFWTSAKSRTVNNIRYIDAIVAGKPVTISEASIRSDLLFDDVDGIDTLNNQAIFDTIQLMGNQLKDVPVPLDHFPVPTLIKKVLTFMVKKGKNFSGNVTPLFDSMLVKPIEDEGEVSERPSESQPIPSHTHPKGFGGNHRGQSSSDKSQSGTEDDLTLQSMYDLCVSLCKQVTTQAANIKDLKSRIKQLKKKARPVINHHKAGMKSLSMKKRLARKKKMESISKQGRKTFKSEPTMHKYLAFDDLDDAMDYMETEDAHNEGTVKDSKEKRVSTKEKVSTNKTKVSTDKLDEGTAEPNEGTAEPKDGNSDEIAAPTTVFRDDETIAQFLVTLSQNKTKQKGVEIKEIKDIDRSRTTTERSILTLKPLPKIDPKDKGKKVLEEKAESKGVNEVERKFAQLANDEEVARKVQEEWESEEEKKKLAKEEATKAAFTNEYDYIQARLNADEILAKKLQEEEREKFTIEQRAKLLHDTIAVQRRFLAQQ